MPITLSAAISSLITVAEMGGSLPTCCKVILLVLANSCLLAAQLALFRIVKNAFSRSE